MNLTPGLSWLAAGQLTTSIQGQQHLLNKEFRGNLPLSRLRKIKQTFNIIMSSAPSAPTKDVRTLSIFSVPIWLDISGQNKLDCCWNISLIKYWLTNYWDPLTPCESSYHSPLTLPSRLLTNLSCSRQFPPIQHVFFWKIDLLGSLICLKLHREEDGDIACQDHRERGIIYH